MHYFLRFQSWIRKKKVQNRLQDEMKKLFRYIYSFLSAGWHGLTFLRRLVANAVFVLLAVVVLSLTFGEKGSKIPEATVLVLAPSGVIVEQRSENLLSSDLMSDDSTSETVLKDVLDALEYAKKDPRIKAVLVDTSKLQGAGLSKLQDIGASLKEFRESGKPVIAFADFFMQRAYYLAAHADRIYISPMGGVLLTGFGIYHNYYKSALDKLQIQFHVFRVGAYKSALEPFMRNDMSDFDRAANSDLLDTMWSAFKNDVARQRQIKPSSLDDYINNFSDRLAAEKGDAAQLALSCGLVDALKTRDQVQKELAGLVGEDRTQSTFNQIRFDEYLKTVRAASPKGGDGEPKVAVIVARGVILDGIQPAGRIGAESLSTLIRQARKDGTIRAIVLRIDSPGGSAFAAESIRRELELSRLAGKPVTVSMGSVAASGGYWIASGADEIWASPTTVTGSIGIFSAFPTFERSLQSLGIFNDGVGTTRLADAFNLSRPMNRWMADALNQVMEQGYITFIKRVAEGRRMETEAVQKIAEGRVWAGRHGVENGLVDKLGGLQAAIASAAKMAGLETYTIDYLEPPLTRRERLLKELREFFALTVLKVLNSLFSEQVAGVKALVATEMDEISMLKDPQGLYAYCPTCDHF
jgi:protease IV